MDARTVAPHVDRPTTCTGAAKSCSRPGPTASQVFQTEEPRLLLRSQVEDTQKDADEEGERDTEGEGEREGEGEGEGEREREGERDTEGEGEREGKGQGETRSERRVMRCLYDPSYDPSYALFADDLDGLSAYRSLAAVVPSLLTSPAYATGIQHYIKENSNSALGDSSSSTTSSDYESGIFILEVNKSCLHKVFDIMCNAGLNISRLDMVSDGFSDASKAEIDWPLDKCNRKAYFDSLGKICFRDDRNLVRGLIFSLCSDSRAKIPISTSTSTDTPL